MWMGKVSAHFHLNCVFTGMQIWLPLSTIFTLFIWPN